MNVFRASTALTISSLFAALLSGCATPINPDQLLMPREMTCVHLKEALEITGLYGPFDVQWTTRLEKGAYWSERMDDKGTYYRAPPGGVSVVGKNRTSFPGQPPTLDGGFYVPDDSNAPVTLYAYFSTAPATVNTPPVDSDCSSVVYVKDPSTSRISLIASAAGGAVGGATGGIIARATTSQSGMSYGQAAGVGAAAGLAGGLIVAAIINAEIGKIISVQPPVKNEQFLGKLRELAATKVLIPESRISTTESQIIPSATPTK